MKNPKNILVIRFSAMGDVVLTVPVILNLLKKHPKTQITLLTRSFFHPFFEGIPNLTLYSVNLDGKHKGFMGLYQLVKELTADQKFDMVIDLHNVIRSRVISSFMRIKGISVYRIDKGRAEKKAFVKGNRSKILPHTTKRYQEAFLKAGFVFPLKKMLLPELNNSEEVKEVISQYSKISIGIAPFAAHKSKEWGLGKIQELIQEINKMYKVHFYLFGGGMSEVQKLDLLAGKYANVTNLAGQFTLKEEIQLLKKLSVFIGMDSGNTHIASLTGIPVISIWGGTHPDIGFKALYQPEENSIQISTSGLPCRPCSVYGTDKCQLKENPFACMTQIEVDLTIKRITEMGILK